MAKKYTREQLVAMGMDEAQIKDNSYVIKKWKKEYTGEWKADESIKVWSGMEEIDQ